MLQSLEQTADGTLHALNFAKKMAEWNDFGFPELGTPARGIGYTVGQVLDNQEFRTNPHKAAFDVRVCFLSVLVYVSWTCMNAGHSPNFDTEYSPETRFKVFFF